MTNEEIATRLGYSEAANFRHAFFEPVAALGRSEHLLFGQGRVGSTQRYRKILSLTAEV